MAAGKAASNSGLESLVSCLDVFHRLNKVCPIWLPEELDTFTFVGFVPVASSAREARTCFLRVHCPRGPTDLVDASFVLEPWAERLLSHCGLQDAVHKRLERAHDLAEFVAEARDLLERCLDGKAVLQPGVGHETAILPLWTLPEPAFYRLLCADLNSIGWSCLSQLGPDFQTITMTATDNDGRIHELLIRDLLSEHPVCIVALPRPMEAVCHPLSGAGRVFLSLLETYHRFRSMLDDLTLFFRVLDDFDRHAWVLEPERPTYAQSMRRLTLAPQCSLVVEIDPVEPSRLPNVRFFGSEQRIEGMRNLFYERTSLWDPIHKTPRENLETILEIRFPPRPSAMDEYEYENECGICYTYHLEGVGVPDWACDVVSCRRPYHSSCLRTWLASIPETRQSFQVYYGSCPYCAGSIHVSKS
jgi:E3 ubiquitin-protein ligase FANCL